MRPTSWREHAYHALLWLVALLFFAPIFWIVLSSFKTADQILAVPPKLIFTPTIANYAKLFSSAVVSSTSCSTAWCCRWLRC